MMKLTKNFIILFILKIDKNLLKILNSRNYLVYNKYCIFIFINLIMLKNLNYISLDLETTGLDIKKDEPIQIGIVKFDNNFNILEKYKSYIKPQSNSLDLKNIVKFVTNINVNDLQDAPYIQDILKQISKYFDKNTVIIGHNIMFDINILSKYMDLSFVKTLDTFHLSHSIFHFLPSYSLEIISEILKKEYNIIIDGDYHDALTDSLASYNIFKFFVERFGNLSNKFPILKNCILRSESIYNQIFDIKDDYYVDKSNYFLPGLKKEVAVNSKIINKGPDNTISKSKDGDKFYVGDESFKKVLYDIATTNKKGIICFQNPSKLKIAKTLLSNLGVKNIGYLGNNSIFDKENTNLFLGKDNFNFFEINFLIKYFSQYDKGHGFLDLSLANDFKISNFLQKGIDKKLSDIVLANHYNLFEFIKNKNISDYKIYFFDRDTWYNSLSKYLNKPFDLYFVIYKLEFFIYKYEIKGLDIYELNKFYTKFIIFTGILFKEITKQFIGISKDIVEIDYIKGNIDFYLSNKLFNSLREDLLVISEKLENEDRDCIVDFFDDMDDIFNNICLIKKMMYDENKFYFTFYRTNNLINYQEFMDFFDKNEVVFFSNNTKEGFYSIGGDKSYSNIKLSKQNDKNKIIDNISKHNNIFILCVNKNKSKELFEYLLNNNYNLNYELLFENITGGVGKNIYYSQIKNKKIVVGGFEFLLNLMSSKISFDHIYVYYAPGAFEKQIIKDIHWYTGIL
ncbi:DNA polymerase III subunit epsilon [Candidatus Vampirococcus lugosii]|uniref:DNA polymerase III subunit epsilon n=2 Tax=Candidatus Vampirococcus lugosii TaxID=2789015 RepID=A0ABS5QLD2_9BACT|nr:DNA polymerase III subunit epsilon [Candidatus Vampirococcus lugosii]